MPVHDWTRVNAGTFHCFRTIWIGELTKSLNKGLLPPEYYAFAEQVVTGMQPDVITLQKPIRPLRPEDAPGSVAIAEAPPRVRLSIRPDPRRKPRRSTSLRRHITIRHTSGHRVVALIEIASPGNKDRKAHVRELTEKIVRSLDAGIHVLLLDLLPPGPFDPAGLHGTVWAQFDRTPFEPPADAPLMLASYAWEGEEPQAFLEPTAVGQRLIDMPLFLTAQHYIYVPLEPTYVSAYEGMPAFWREVLEQPLR